MPTTAKTEPLTNKEFGAAVGIHHSMASRIRNGVRAPGADTIGRIAKVYGIDEQKLLAAKKKGPEAFGKIVDSEIYKKGLRPKSPARAARKAS